MSQYWPLKDPDDILDYSIDWSNWLETDTILTSTWILPTGISKINDSHSSTITIIWLSGGTAGETYEILNRITTAGGRTKDKTIRLKVFNSY
jgi:hypothetical protein